MLSGPCLDLQSLENLQLPELDRFMGINPPVHTNPGTLNDDNPDELISPAFRLRRLIIVSNQLPLKISTNSPEKWRFELDEDALSLHLKDGLDPEIEIVYVGCLKIFIDPSDQDELSGLLFEKFRCLPVFVPEEVYNRYYHGFCKHYLWPLFHYKLPISAGLDTRTGSCFDRNHWQGYVGANIMFAHQVIDEVRRGGGFVWIHDYHLMLLPTLLRRRDHELKLGFFLHSPFPSSEIFRIVPVREEILRGLLNCNLVGFHTFDYARHFLSCCSRMLGLDYKSKRGYLGLDYYGRTVSIKILPVGIHMSRIQTLMSEPETATRIRQLREKFKGRSVIVGVDDMDVLKGISFKFLAMGHLLETHPSLRGRLVLLQITNPARSRGMDIQEVENEIRSIAREVNSKFSMPRYDPIVLLEDPVSSLEKAAYYAISDCCLLNAIRDGMNLVPYKYTVCRQGGSSESDSGVPKCSSMIIVSEFVGCSPSLSGAIRVNPWNVEQVAEAMQAAVTMDDSEKKLRHEQHYKYISSHDIAYWSRSFYQDLIRACGDPSVERVWGIGFGLNYRLITLPPDFRKLSVDLIKAGYNGSKSRLILLDYDGTMAPQRCMEKPPSEEVIAVLNALCSDPKNTVFIVSGRGKDRLDRMFSPCEKLGISAEQGFFIRWSRDLWWESSMVGKNVEWKNIVGPIMEVYAETTDGAFIEENECTMVWHYLDTDHDFGSCQSKEMLDHLETVLANEPVTVKRGKLKVEVKAQGVSKGVVVENLMGAMRKMGKAPDLVVCIGDDRSDEDMFESLKRVTSSNPNLPPIPQIFTCTVGQKPSMAKYYLDHTSEVVMFLWGLVRLGLKSLEPNKAHASSCSSSGPSWSESTGVFMLGDLKNLKLKL